jgi:hypothetical protein
MSAGPPGRCQLEGACGVAAEEPVESRPVVIHGNGDVRAYHLPVGTHQRRAGRPVRGRRPGQQYGRLGVGLIFAFQGKIRHEIERGQDPNDLAVLNNRHVLNAMVDHACGYVPDAPVW